ncbi:MAG: protease inhibitor I42 family protein [Nitrospirae bacterium]|nr:protease inhibitor I42 family protein [Candidatus Manganitrophaceae bacterium]
MAQQIQHELKKIQVKVGEPFKVRFWEDRTRGSRYVPTYDTAALKALSDEYERTRHVRTNDIGMHSFEFVATQPGNHIIEFECRYGWKFSAEDRLVYEIEVKAP